MSTPFLDRLRSAAPAQRLTLAAEWLAVAGSGFDAAGAELLAAELRGAGASPEWFATLPHNPASAWVSAQLATTPAAAAAAWARFFALQARRDPFDQLAFARCLADCGRIDDAIRQIRLALSQPVRYAFFPRAQKLVARLAAASTSHIRECRIAVLGSSTTSLLVPLLEALCLRDGIRAEFYQGLYGAITQEVLDGTSGLAQFRPAVVFLVTHWRDLHLDGVADDEAAAVEAAVAAQQALWQRLGGQFGCHVVQHAFDYPAADAWGLLSGKLPGGRARLIEKINRRMLDEAPSYVSVLDTPALQREAGLARWEDPFAWSSFRQHPATDALSVLAEAQLAHIRAVLGLTKKVLVTDLDNTLWKGVIGEDGLDGIGIGPGTPAGEAHAELQRYLVELRRRGILLAVCSKNNPDDARLPFEKHPHMPLRLDDFAVFRANWDDKVANLRAMAEELSLGLDSFVFLDDNPLEREWVRSQLPQVAVVELGASVFHYVPDLARGRWFDALTLSAEDLARSEQYRVEARRESLRTSAGSMEEFLAQLQLEAAAVPVTDGNLARVTQLINKTNQFNLTTRRYTEAQVRLRRDDPHTWMAAFEMADRMGNYGLIGVLLCVAQQDQPGTWEIDTWLMSCRTLGRQMERFMFDRMVEAAIAHGVRRLVGVYRPTPKNMLVAGLFEQLGFTRIGESPEEARYEFAVPAVPLRTATHVRDRTAVPAEAVTS